jgi:small-conductance mechanosensitive channel
MKGLIDILEAAIRENSLRDWLLAGLVFVATFLVVPFVRGRIRAQQQKWHSRQNPLLELISRLTGAASQLVVLSLALYFAEKLLALPPEIDRVFEVVIVFGATYQLALWAVAALRFGVERHYGGGHEPGASAAVGVLMFVGQVLVWAVFVLLALDNLGVNVTALVAGLGIGGVAIALAVQSVLGDLLGSVSIALDKPFAIGDQLQIDDIEGTVEHVGIKSTRLRSLTGEQVILANADVLKSRVHNLGRMSERRVLFRFGVTYETTPAKLEQVAGIVRQAVESVPGTRFLQCPLMALGAASLDFEPIYFIANRPDVPLGGTQNAVNLAILRGITDAGIDFAYPTQRLLVRHSAMDAPGPTSPPA